MHQVRIFPAVKYFMRYKFYKSKSRSINFCGVFGVAGKGTFGLSLLNR
jgi:hypothetical protein